MRSKCAPGALVVRRWGALGSVGVRYGSLVVRSRCGLGSVRYVYFLTGGTVYYTGAYIACLLDLQLQVVPNSVQLYYIIAGE